MDNSGIWVLSLIRGWCLWATTPVVADFSLLPLMGERVTRLPSSPPSQNSVSSIRPSPKSNRSQTDGKLNSNHGMRQNEKISGFYVIGLLFNLKLILDRWSLIRGTKIFEKYKQKDGRPISAKFLQGGAGLVSFSRHAIAAEQTVEVLCPLASGLSSDGFT